MLKVNFTSFIYVQLLTEKTIKKRYFVVLLSMHVCKKVSNRLKCLTRSQLWLQFNCNSVLNHLIPLRRVTIAMYDAIIDQSEHLHLYYYLNNYTIER